MLRTKLVSACVATVLAAALPLGLAAPGLAGIMLNGIMLNGIMLNGIMLNGRHWSARR